MQGTISFHASHHGCGCGCGCCGCGCCLSGSKPLLLGLGMGADAALLLLVLLLLLLLLVILVILLLLVILVFLFWLLSFWQQASVVFLSQGSGFSSPKPFCLSFLAVVFLAASLCGVSFPGLRV